MDFIFQELLYSLRRFLLIFYKYFLVVYNSFFLYNIFCNIVYLYSLLFFKISCFFFNNKVF